MFGRAFAHRSMKLDGGIPRSVLGEVGVRVPDDEGNLVAGTGREADSSGGVDRVAPVVSVVCC